MVTQAEVHNVLKKWSATVTKRDAETGLPQGDATLSGAVYGVFKGEELVDTYITDESGQFTTTDYVCGDDWTIRELSPSEGYLLDNTVYPVGAEPQRYTAEYNPIALDVTEQVIRGDVNSQRWTRTTPKTNWKVPYLRSTATATATRSLTPRMSCLARWMNWAAVSTP